MGTKNHLKISSEPQTVQEALEILQSVVDLVDEVIAENDQERYFQTELIRLQEVVTKLKWKTSCGKTQFAIRC